MPSELTTATVLLTPATATKMPFPKVTDLKVAETGRVRAVHVIPSVLVAAEVVLRATATKTPFP
jgi:hypothetical protein